MPDLHHFLHSLVTTPINIGWKVLTALTILSVLDMGRNLLRRVRHIFP
jgi:hypothetical protein